MLLLMILAMAADTNVKVEIDGHPYRVETKQGVVRVVQKAFITKVSFDARARMRRAVVTATGCKITDDYWVFNSLEGSLDCTK